jgi:N-acyl-D-amino-acid deacylase
MDERDLDKFAASPRVLISSDGGLSGAHPRGYGAFPRVLGVYVREKGVLSLPVAVQKMTSASAGLLGLSDRGTIAVGKKADLVLFDPATVADRGTKTDPSRAPVGIRWVLVNGEVVLDDGRLAGARPGRAVRRENWQAYARDSAR